MAKFCDTLKSVMDAGDLTLADLNQGLTPQPPPPEAMNVAKRKGKRAFQKCMKRRLGGKHFKGRRSARKALGAASRACARRAY